MANIQINKYKLFLFWISIFLITLCHYFTPAKYPLLHALYRRLYYIPIILIAINSTTKQSILASGLITLFYTPHVLLEWNSIPLQKYEAISEMVLYNIIAYLTSVLVTKIRLAHKRNETLLSKLQFSEKLSTLSETMAVITHEIKTPLATVLMTMETLKSELKIANKNKIFFDIIEKELMRINNIASNTPSIFREKKLNLVKIHLTPYIDELKELSNLICDNNKIKLSWNVDIATPFMYIEPDLFKNIFINLLTNAVDAIQGRGDIIIHIFQKNNIFIFTIQDTGIGIDTMHKKNIFNPFITTKKEHIGIGLSIVKRIIDLHNGSIECESKINEGTKFIIKIPIYQGNNNYA